MAAPRYAWSEQSARYRNLSTGRYVTASEVRSALDSALQAAADRMAALTEQLRAGELTLSRWQVEMATSIKDVHLYSAAAAKGGFQQMTQADYGRVGQIVRREYAYLRDRANAIADGSQPLDGTLTARSRLYGQAGRDTYHAVEQREMAIRGQTECRNVLTATESCAGCLAETAKGWQPIGAGVPIGSRTCLRNCRCSWVYR